MKKPANKSIIATVMALLAVGGVGTGYVLVRDNQADVFENSVHQVVRVIDGDTIELENEVRVRLLGIDAPESGQCFYEEAKVTLTGMLQGEVIKIRKDITGADQYGRLLRYAYQPSLDPVVSDVFVNYELVRSGLARKLVISPNTQYSDLLASAEKEARESVVGGWAYCDWLTEYEETHSTRATHVEPSDSACVIKGNISEKAFGKNYFVPGCPNYNIIKISPEKGEQYFCTEAEAVKAGFTRSASCR